MLRAIHHRRRRRLAPAATGPSGAPALQAKTLAAYACDEASGNLIDILGVRNFTATNGPTATDGKVGGGRRAKAASLQSFDSPTVPPEFNMFQYPSFEITMFMRPNAALTSGDVYIWNGGGAGLRMQYNAGGTLLNLSIRRTTGGNDSKTGPLLTSLGPGYNFHAVRIEGKTAGSVFGFEVDATPYLSTLTAAPTGGQASLTIPGFADVDVDLIHFFTTHLTAAERAFMRGGGFYPYTGF